MTLIKREFTPEGGSVDTYASLYFYVMYVIVAITNNGIITTRINNRLFYQ